MQDTTNCVREFHGKMRAPIAATPTLLPCDLHAAAELSERVAALAAETMARASTSDVLLRRAAMALEELAEWLEAHAEGDLVAAADAWADRAYVLFGDAVATGLPASSLFAEVHSSNMTKQPDPIGTGKALKVAGYQAPDISTVLGQQDGWT